ncbi:MAG: hypothetical protein IPJ30_13055 [Acidobacteria bacterium]|nr:hypothetical protein [Acidobacteriota bacterium]
MKKSGIDPNVVTYNTLINLAPDYATAVELKDEMKKSGIDPNPFTYSGIFSKDLTNINADHLLSWLLSERKRFPNQLQAAIKGFRMANKIEQALRIVLDYPYLDGSAKIMRDFQGIRLNTVAKHEIPEHRANAAYSSGLIFS